MLLNFDKFTYILPLKMLIPTLGNNNTYCQDNDLNYYSWDDEDETKYQFLEFVKTIILIRKKEAVLQRRKHFHGTPSKFSGIKDISWYHPEGRDLTAEEWNNPSNQSMMYVLEGTSIDELSQDGKRIIGDTLLVLINGQFNDVKFVLPPHRSRYPWALLMVTSQKHPKLGQLYNSGEEFNLQDHSMAVLCLFQTKQRERKA